MPPAELREEQVAEATEDQVTADGRPLADLEVVHAEFVLGLLEHAFDASAAEGHPKQRLGGRGRGRPGDEELDLAGDRAAGHHQVVWRGGQAMLVLQPHREVLGLPHHRPFGGVLDVIGLPRHPAQEGRVAEDVLDLHGGIVLRLQARIAGASPPAPLASVGPVPDRRPPCPDVEIGGHLGHVVLAQGVQSLQKRGFSAVVLVEGQPPEADPVGDGPPVLLQGHLPLGPVDNRLRDARQPAPGTVGVPGLPRQVGFAVHEGVEVGRGVAQVDADQAVLGLAHGPAVLPLDAGGAGALLGETGLVDEAHAAGLGVPAGHPLLEPVPQGLLVPSGLGQELLKGPRRGAGGVGDRLDALAREARELAPDVRVEVPAGVGPGEAVVELVQESGQLGADPQNRVRIHGIAPFRTWGSERSHRLAA